MAPRPATGPAAGRTPGRAGLTRRAAPTLASMGDPLDVLLVVAVGLFALSGYRQGFLIGALSFVGFLGGGVLGAQLAPGLARRLVDEGEAPLVGLVVVVAAALLGQLAAAGAGTALRSRLVRPSARALDAGSGAVLSALSFLLVAWLLASAVDRAPYPGLVRRVHNSVVLNAVDALVPDGPRRWFAAFRELVDEQAFPEVFSGLGGGRIVPVPPPDPTVQNSPAVQRARPSVLRVRGEVPDCRRAVEGSGFVYAAERVMTNAHVLAGVRSPRVTARGRTLPAAVVFFDPERDVAVLRVPGLGLPALPFAAAAAPGADAVVAGYPLGGPFTAVPARVRNRQTARGADIHGVGRVTRDVFALRAVVRPGNSGGPLLTRTGQVYGVIFAAASDDDDTGYALTAAEVAPAAVAGRGATAEVGTGRCD
jgi:S1-C subfamily serine protease